MPRNFEDFEYFEDEALDQEFDEQEENFYQESNKKYYDLMGELNDLSDREDSLENSSSYSSEDIIKYFKQKLQVDSLNSTFRLHNFLQGSFSRLIEKALLTEESVNELKEIFSEIQETRVELNKFSESIKYDYGESSREWKKSKNALPLAKTEEQKAACYQKLSVMQLEIKAQLEKKIPLQEKLLQLLKNREMKLKALLENKDVAKELQAFYQEKFPKVETPSPSVAGNSLQSASATTVRTGFKMGTIDNQVGQNMRDVDVLQKVLGELKELKKVVAEQQKQIDTLKNPTQNLTSVKSDVGRKVEVMSVD